MKIPRKRTRMYSASFCHESRSFKETLMKSLLDFIFGFLYRTRRHSMRIASYLRRTSTTLCIKTHIKSDPAMEQAFP